MAQLTINIPDAVVARVMDAFAAEYVYDSNSGLTKAQFAKQQIVLFMKDVVKRHENSLVSQQYTSKIEAEGQTINNDVDNNLMIT